MPSFFKGHVITVVYPLSDIPDGWSRQKIEQWITANHGKAETKFTERTTHLVCSREAWAKKVPAVEQALDCERKVWIVTPAWLVECLQEVRKAREGPFAWQKVAGDKSKASNEKGDRSPKTTAGLMAQVFHESADQFVSEADRKQIEQDRLMAKKMEEEMEREREKEAKEARAKEAMSKKSGKKAKNEVFADNHHIYADSTGFKYDVLLTKVDVSTNRNERLCLSLQIHETNSEPHSYAANIHSAGTSRIPSNNIIAALGSNLPTALRVFKEIFEEKTGVPWDLRILAAIERREKKKRARGIPAVDLEVGSARNSAGRGRAVSEREVEMERLREVGRIGDEELPFAERKFEYAPPTYGPRSLLPEGMGGPGTEKGKGNEKELEDVDRWLEGTGDQPMPGDLDEFFGGSVEGLEGSDVFMSGALNGDGAEEHGASEADPFGFGSGLLDDHLVGAGEAANTIDVTQYPAADGLSAFDGMSTLSTDFTQYTAAQDTRQHLDEFAGLQNDNHQFVEGLLSATAADVATEDLLAGIVEAAQSNEHVDMPQAADEGPGQHDTEDSIGVTQAAEGMHQEVLGMLAKHQATPTEGDEPAAKKARSIGDEDPDAGTAVDGDNQYELGLGSGLDSGKGAPRIVIDESEQQRELEGGVDDANPDAAAAATVESLG